jgi:peroxisomal 3,2-trans-enoyl-CoA isomerase
MAEPGILIEYKRKVAIITLNVPKKLNALNGDLYYQLARAMHEVASHDEVFITVLTGRGRFFSAYVSIPSTLTILIPLSGADVTFGAATKSSTDIDERQMWLKSFVANNLHITVRASQS